MVGFWNLEDESFLKLFFFGYLPVLLILIFFGGNAYTNKVVVSNIF